MNQNSNNHEKEPTNEGGFWSRFGFGEKEDTSGKKDDERQDDHKPEESKQEEKKQQPKDDRSERLTKEEKLERKRAKRRKVVARSRNQVSEADKKDPYRTRNYSPIERVSLALAERIVRLDTRLHTGESLDEADVSSIEYAIDFMGLMTDKLEDPETEAAPEVDAAIAVLLEPLVSPQETLRFETSDEVQENLAADVKDMIVAIDSTRRETIEPWLVLTTTERQVTQTSTSSQSAHATIESNEMQKPEVKRIDPEQILETANDYRRMVPTVMRVLKKERRKQETNYVSGPGVGTASAAAAVAGTVASATHEEPKEIQPPMPLLEQSSVTTRRTSGHVSAPERRGTPDSSRPIAASRILHEQGNKETHREKLAPVVDTDHTRPPVEAKHLSENPHVTAVPESISKKRPEELSLRELLHEAEHISVGHGMYLRQAFERGEIDQKGLVDIIKSKRKGRDYRQEFSLQKQSFARKKRESPEFLHQSESTMPQQKDTSHAPSMSDTGEKIAREPLSQPVQSPSNGAERTQVAGAKSTDHREDLLGDILSSNKDKQTQTNKVGWLLLAVFVVSIGGLILWLF